MQFKKLVAAGTLSALMLGATVGFAALKDYPAPFVTSSGVQSFVVVGATAAPGDVVGAIDLAARLGGSVTSDVAVPGAVGSFSVSGEGKALDTTTTHVFMNEDLGKTGLRTTLTRDDLPTILAKGSFADADGTHKYDLYIDMTPGTTNPTKADVKYGKPGSSSSADPTYVIGEQSTGRLSTSPSNSEYLYRTRVVFDVPIGNNSISKSLKLFGNDYTVSADSSIGVSTDKIVLFGGADVQTLSGGQSITTTVGGQSYDVKLVGVTSSNSAVLQVGGNTETVAKGSTSTAFGDLKIYVKDAAQLSGNDQTQNIATLLIGADRVTLQDSSKVKKGNNDDNVDGTYVELGRSGVKISTITIYFAAKSSTSDYIAAGADTYLNQVFNTFGVKFAGMSPAVSGASDDELLLRNSGDNSLQATVTDYNGNKATLTYGYKASSGALDLLLADSNGNAFVQYEGGNVTRDQTIVLSAGGFPHMFKVTNVALDGTSSASIDLQDSFTGATTKVTTGTDNTEAAVIDGQTYYFQNNTASSFTVTWGTGAAVGSKGTYTTVWPKLKTLRGATFAFARNVTNLPFNSTYDLPTGAAQINCTVDGAGSCTFAITGWSREDGTVSSATNYGLTLDNATTFQLGRTTTGGLFYRITKVTGGTFSIGIVGATNGTATYGNATFVLSEEKDDAGAESAIVFPGATGSSGSNYLAGVGAAGFSGANSQPQTWGSNSNKGSTVDLWGTLVVRDTSTSAQPWVDVFYPDTQRVASVFVLADDATTSSSAGVSGSVVKTATPVKTPLGKLDTEITSADKANMNLILVGGPAVNTLVKKLATDGKTKDVDWYVAQGSGTALIQLVSDAFASGKSALVVAGYGVDDTRAATSALQKYDAYTWASDTTVLKNGVISTATA